MKPVLAFDLNGTLTDIGALDPFFAQIGLPGRRQEWFSQLIELAMTVTLTGRFEPFGRLADDALQMVGARHALAVTNAQKQQLRECIFALPLFPEVRAGFQRLREGGYRLAVLTNSGKAIADKTMERHQLASFLEQVLSVEMVQVYKPAPVVYRTAAEKLGVSPPEMMLVAGHSWDTTGAMRAGCQAAFIKRPGEVLDPGGPRPQIVASDVEDLARQLSERPRPDA